MANKNVLFVGLGNMGLPMARNLCDAGFSVTGYDVSEKARATAAQSGLSVTENLSEAASSAGITVLMLPNSDIVDAVVLDAGGLAASLPEGNLLIDMSSSEPSRTQALSVAVAKKGIRLIDAPVSGGVKGAVAATLTIMAGGCSADLDEAQPALDALGRTTRTGEVGSGHALKALNNLLSGVTLLATCEVVEVARKFGLADQVVLDVLNSSSGRSWSSEFKWPTFILPELFNSGFGMRLLAKDMRIAVEMGDSLGLPMSLGEEALAHWDAASQELPADADHTHIDLYARKPHRLAD